MTIVAATSLLIISFVAGGLGFVFLFVSVPLQIFKSPQPKPREEKLHKHSGILLQMQWICFCCFLTVCIIIADIDCAARILPCFRAKVLPSLLGCCSSSSICHAHFFLPLPSANYSLVRDGTENLCLVWCPLCSHILILVFLTSCKQISSAPEMTLLRDILFWG